MKLKLDMAKWRSGVDGIHKIGEGQTRLLNRWGYMCCLGQFSQQNGAKNLRDKSYPTDVSCTKNMDENFHDFLQDNQQRFTRINDADLIPPTEKIHKIRALLEKGGHTLQVTNYRKFGLKKEDVN